MINEPGNKEVSQERHFNQNLDLSPLEHLLIGSGTRLPDGNPLTLSILNGSNENASDRDFLLKPNGLRKGTASLEEIKKGRQVKNAFSFTPPFLKVGGGFLFDYNFKLFLPRVDNEGYIIPEFAMQMQKNTKDGPKSLAALEGEDKSVYGQIDLDQSYKSLFSLEKHSNTTLLTLRYLPLQKPTRK